MRKLWDLLRNKIGTKNLICGILGICIAVGWMWSFTAWRVALVDKKICETQRGIASRIGVRLTPSLFASWISINLSPGLNSPRRIACLSVLNTTSLSGRYSFSLTFKFCSMLSTSSLPGVYSLHIPVLPVSVPLSSVPHVSLTVCLQISQIRSDHFRSS